MVVSIHVILIGTGAENPETEHSTHLVLCVGPRDLVSARDVVSLGRLATTVRKKAVFAHVQADLPATDFLASAMGTNVVLNEVEWTSWEGDAAASGLL
jgi:tRNA splicing endonuclease